MTRHGCPSQADYNDGDGLATAQGAQGSVLRVAGSKSTATFLERCGTGLSVACAGRPVFPVEEGRKRALAGV